MNKKIFKNKKYIGSGLFGDCYELTNGDVLKIFKMPQSISNIKKYKLFQNYQNESIMFPYDFYVKHRKFLGYISKKAPGKGLDESLKLYNLEDLSKDLFKLDRDVMHISGGGIIMRDVHSDNVFYDGNKYSIIDTDAYKFCDEDFDQVSIYYDNIRKVKSAIFESIYENFVIDKDTRLYHELRKYCIWNYDIGEALLNISNKIEEYNIDKDKFIKKLKR